MPFKIEHLEKGPPLPFAEYRYNQNSQIDSVFYNNSSYYITNYYNTRNWIIQSNSSSNNQFNYALEYYANGNISNQNINGDYKGNFSDTKEIRVSYTYDNSNRLTDAEPFSRQYFDLRGTYVYDADGNFSVLTRSYNGDGFNYEYYTGTNRLKKVTGESDQFTYDYNGNLTNDYFNNNTDIKYDHRNLIIEIIRVDELVEPPTTYITTYKYDEAGNRIQKIVTKDDGSTMEIIVNEYYIRDVSGKEIGIYQNDTLKFWNVWGNGNEGRITPDGIRYYYIKDHLGSIRAVLNDSNNLVEAIDNDAWGHIARYWTTSPTKYKFTGKERDNETGYDYFGARYYDARIGRWGQIEPMFNKYISFSTYQYSLLNPMILIDADGKDIYLKENQAKDVYNIIKQNSSFDIQYDESTGKLTTILKSNEGLSGADKLLFDAITNPDFIINMICDDVSKRTNEYGNVIPIGRWGGHKDNIATQYIYTNDIKQASKLQIRTEYGSVIHELLEAYIGVTENKEYEYSHEEVMKLLKQEELAYKYQNVQETTNGKTIFYTRLLIGKDENSLKPFLKYDSEGRISYY